MSKQPHHVVRLEYDRLVREYLENLNVNLRGFHPAEEFEFLSAWVPNEDPTEGMMDLVDLAKDASIHHLTILLGPESSRAVDWDRLGQQAGEYHRHDRGDQTVVEFVLPPTVGVEIHPAYVRGLRSLLGDIRHEGVLSGTQEQDVTEVTIEGVTLAALIERKRRTVLRAAFRGACTPAQRGLLESLCRMMESRPIQECSDHALIAVEHDLRDPAQSPPVAGVVTPENADPAFHLPQRLVRGIIASYISQTGYSDTRNFYERPIGKQWAALNEQQRGDAVRAALAAGGVSDRVQLVAMDGARRAVVRFADGLGSDAKQQLLVQLDTQLRQTVEPTLQLVAQVRVDSNLLRKPDRPPST